MSAIDHGADHTALGDRMHALLALRLTIAAIVLGWAALRPELLGTPLSVLAGVSVAYATFACLTEWARRRSARYEFALLSLVLLVDGLYLAGAMYMTGGMQSPVRFLVYLHLVAVSLLASYRTGLKLALWDSLLLIVVLYAQAAMLVPAVDVEPGVAIEFERMPVLYVTSFWLFALATSVFSAMSERELRHSRADLQALVDIGARLDDISDPILQSELVLDGLRERFGFRRGVVLGAADDGMIVLAALGTSEPPTVAGHADAVIARTWQGRRLLPIRRLDPAANPILTALLPDAANLLVAPMVADGRPVGAVVVEHPSPRAEGVDRRVASVLEQLCAIAALNLRNAVLLRHVQDLADRDALTGVANRRMFQLSLERVLAERVAGSKPSVTAVLFVDLDDFKVVNDSLGHTAGDSVLQAVTERIAASVREGDLVARLGGDEFAILTQDRPGLKRSKAMAERLARRLRAPYQVGGRQVTVTASIGIASARDASRTAADIVRDADVAMYMAKANGKAGVAVYDPGMRGAIRERHELGVQLLKAVELGQLRLTYQPIVDLSDNRLVGIEALVRWDHPERGVIPPGEFLEIAEENGAIVPLGRWILAEACREAASWSAIDGSVSLSINVSAREVQQPGFVEAVRDALDAAGLPASRLTLEVTETALLKATPTTIDTLETLRALGVRIAIDDFGTGYYSLSHLRDFQVDVIKIASDFVRVAEGDALSAALASAIVAMGGSLEIGTVAEGIETADQVERMRALGCVFGQGYFFAQPTPGAEVAAGAFATLVDPSPPAVEATEPRPSTATTHPFRAPFGGFARRRAAAVTEASPA